MKIEHVALYVNELEKAKAFFVRYFNAKANEKYHNPKTNFMSYFLSFEDGARLEIMTRPEIVEINKDLYRTGYAHIAVSVGSKEKVDSLTEQFRADGYTVVGGSRTTGDGYYESSILDFEGNLIEITE